MFVDSLQPDFGANLTEFLMVSHGISWMRLPSAAVCFPLREKEKTEFSRTDCFFQKWMGNGESWTVSSWGSEESFWKVDRERPTGKLNGDTAKQTWPCFPRNPRLEQA